MSTATADPAKPKSHKKAFDPTKKPETVGDVFRKFCMTTSVRGVGRIFKTKSRLLTFMWATTVLCFLVLSVYQVSEIISGYFRFETTQEQKIKIPRTIPFPDITLCNLQPFRRQSEAQIGRISDAEVLVNEYFNNVTKRMDEYGKGVTGATDWDRSDAPFDHEASEGESIENNPYYNAYDYFAMGEGNEEEEEEEEEEDDTEYYDEGDVTGESLKRSPEIVDNSTLEGILSTTAAIYQNINQTMQEELGHKKNMIDHCVFTVQLGRRLKTDKCKIKRFKHPQFFNCFTVARDETRGTILDLSLQLFLDDDIHLFYPDKYWVDKESQLHGVKVIVHEPWSYPNVEQKGFNVPPGMAANFYLLTTLWQNQPPPYGQCSKEVTDSEILTWDGKVYHYEKQTCQDQCIQEYINEKCNCVDAWLVHPRNNTKDLPFCVDVKADLGTLIRRVACMYDFRVKPPKSCTCALPCYRYDYGTTETMSEWPHESFHLPLYNMVKNERNLTIEALESILKTKKEYDNHDHGTGRYDMSKIMRAKDILMDTDSFQRNFVSVMVQRETFEVSIVKEKPDITLAKLWSSVGGIMCIWLGITLITTMELVELVYDLIMYCCDRGQSKETPVENGEDVPMSDGTKTDAEKV